MASTTSDIVKIIVLTGASSGIGEATARHLAREGHYLYIGARRLDRLTALQDELRGEGGHVEAVQLDVTRPEDLQTLVARAHAEHGRVDVLINNAGVMPLSPLAALKIDEWNRTLDVNVCGVLHGIAAFLPIMLAQGNGHIVNIASVGAHQVWPSSAVYCASKFAVRAISEGLRQQTDAIRVTLVSPSVVESELADHITDPGAWAAMRDFRRIALQPQAVAQAIAQPDGVDMSELIVRPTASPY